ncbi:MULTISPECIES: WD40 repeat domain-containing serine/threonine protein kinase [Pseudofrankia]|uniref:WD40 repeat domain-containing serine/threonine protein kinase n=1 Tax=Pseudofrankia TaxID=2994363 RepID=UPI000234BD53|nr:MULTISPECIES: serine/threonine-protein kinase [Pseudofrankia]OHV37027.1 hypothetical protein BCD49_17470 [Pseudofrankia sp. EUN1h]
MITPRAVDERPDGGPVAIGPYRLLRRLGTGGMGTVYLADRPGAAEGDPSRHVAVKIIHAHLAELPDFRRRFARETAAARRVPRFCSAEVLDVNMDGPSPYLVMEYIDGPTLSERVEPYGHAEPYGRAEPRPLRAAELERLAIEIAAALVAIHAAGVVHRDLSPRNVMLSAKGTRVIDFGIARPPDATTLLSQRIIGTPAYMAPEQARNERVGEAGDVHAWGAVLVYAASGEPPFLAASTPQTLLRIERDPPDHLDRLPRALRPLVEWAMDKHPENRPTAAELLSLLLAGGAGADPAPVDPAPVDVADQGATGGGYGWAGRSLDSTAVLPGPWWRRALDRARPPRHLGGPADDAARRGWLTVPLTALAAAVVTAAVAVPLTAALTTGLGSGGREDAGTRPSTTATPTATAPARPQFLGRPLTAFTAGVYEAAFSPDSGTLATASAEGTVRLWDLADPKRPTPLGQPITRHEDGSLRPGDGAALAAVFSPDGTTLAVAGDHGWCGLWDVTDRTRPVLLTDDLSGGQRDAIKAVAFDPGQNVLATAGADGTIRLWDLSDRMYPVPVRTLRGPKTGAVWTLAFSPDGATLATGGGDGAVRLWDVSHPRVSRLLAETPVRHTGDVRSVVFSPDGATVASAGSDGDIRLWDVRRPTSPTALGGPVRAAGGTGRTGAADHDSVLALSFSPDGGTLASGDRTGTVTLWDVTDRGRPHSRGQLIGHTGADPWVYSVAFSRDGATLASASHDHTVRLWRLR